MERLWNSKSYDAIVIGSGPNGLAAAITLARVGLKVLILEANETLGGGARSSALTLPGFLHDECSAIHPMALASPFFRQLPLHEHGLEWVQPPAPLAHPLDDGSVATLERSLEATAKALGKDGPAYHRLFGPLVSAAEQLFADLLGPLRWPRHLGPLMQFGWRAVQSARGLAHRWFHNKPAQALFAGLAGHAILPLERAPSAAVALMLGTAGHAVGWPLPRGGAQRITDALTAYFRAIGGEVQSRCRVDNINELPPCRAILMDVTPRQVLQIAGHKLPRWYSRQLRHYRYGPGVFKLDWALSAPIPWKAPDCLRAATVHLGGTLAEIAAAERSVDRGYAAIRPYVLVAQPSLFDDSRAPLGQHTAWAYCHVPHGSIFDMTERIEAQMERFAPGFRDCILARHVMSPAEMQRRNANYIGGDINGGEQDFGQLFSRPVLRLDPYAMPTPGLFLCSSSTPPGGGVHGMCGYWAAQSALRSRF